MLVAQFVLVNVVVAVLMKHLEESNKEAREDAELDAELEMEMAQGSPARPRPAAPQSPGASPDSPNVLVVRKVSVSRMLSLPNDSYMFRPVAPAAAAHPHPLQEVEMETYAGGAAGTAPGGGRLALGGRGPGRSQRGDGWGQGPGQGQRGDGAGRAGVRGAWIVGRGPLGVDTRFWRFPAAGRVTAAHSPPVESCTSLQVPSAVSSPSRGGDTLRALPPQGAARSPSVGRLLCRQVGGAFGSSA